MAQDRRSFNPARLQQLASAVSNVAASLHDYKVLSKNVAKVIVSLSNDRCSSKEIAHAISRSLGNGFAPVLGSFRVIPGAPITALAGFVTRNTEVITPEDERYNRMRPLTASIMLDPQDESMWDIRRGDSGTFLVRAGDEDLSSLLVTASVRDVNSPRMASLASCSSAGEFISFVDVNQGVLKHGFVLASDGDQVQVVTEDDEQPVTIGEDSVVEAAILHGQDVEVAATVGIDSTTYDSRSPAAMTEYYRQLYAYAPAFAEDVVKQINSHSAV